MVPKKILDLISSGRYSTAASRLTRLLAGDADGSAHYHLSLCLYLQGIVDRSLRVLQGAISANGANPDHWNLYALLMESLGRYDEAEKAAEKSVLLAPNVLDFQNTKAKIELNTGRVDEAVERLRNIVALDPNFREARLNLAAAYAKLGKNNDLISLCPREFLDHVKDPKVFYWLAVAKSQTGDSSGAGSDMARFLRLKHSRSPIGNDDLKVANFSSGIGHLIESTPSFFDSEDEINLATKTFNHAIEALSNLRCDQRFDASDRPLVLDGFFKITNFYLAYQQQRDLPSNKKYAEMVRSYLRDVGIELDLTGQADITGKLSIALISENIGLHITTWTLDWMRALKDDLGPAITIYCVNHPPETGLLEELGTLGNVVKLTVIEDTFTKTLETIRENRHDLVFFPDVGMCPSSRMLSMVRLGRYQAVHWGHPVTTGSPAIDFFLSGRLMENVSTRQNYSERLICLPGLGASFQTETDLVRLIGPKPNSINIDPPQSADEDDYYELCSVQSLFKHLPQFDVIYLEILKQVPSATIGFLYSDDETSSRFFSRIWKNAEKLSIDGGRIRKVVKRPHSQFIELLKRVKVSVDAIGWAGGNTTLNALSLGTPVLTMIGPTMRANHSAGMYRRMGLEELICRNPTTFIDLGVKLLVDENYRESVRASILERHSLIYDHRILNKSIIRLVKKIPNPRRVGDPKS